MGTPHSDFRNDWRIRGYRHDGRLLIETTHRGDASKDTELLAFHMRTKDVGYIDLIDCNRNTTTRMVRRGKGWVPGVR